MNFLSHQFIHFGRAYRTVAAYKCALAHPLWTNFGIPLGDASLDVYMRGIFNLDPPVRLLCPRGPWTRSLSFCCVTILNLYILRIYFESLRRPSASFYWLRVGGLMKLPISLSFMFFDRMERLLQSIGSLGMCPNILIGFFSLSCLLLRD